jgi:hypothetical protein
LVFVAAPITWLDGDSGTAKAQGTKHLTTGTADVTTGLIENVRQTITPVASVAF